MPVTSYEILRMLLPVEVHPLPEDRQAVLRKLIAQICQMPQDEIYFPKHKKDGLWLCLSLPKVKAQQLVDQFSQNDEALHPLCAEFVIGQLNLLPIIYDSVRLTELRPDHESLIRLVYPGAERLEVEQILEHDHHDNLVLLTRVLHGHGKPFVRQIVKIGNGPELRRTWQVYRRNTQKRLPLIAPRLDNYVEWRGMAAMNYSYVGGGMFGQTRPLAEFYQDSGVSTSAVINIIDTMLGDALGYHWYAQNMPLVCSFAEAYSAVLTEHLRVRLRPDSADGVARPGGAPDYLAGYRRLTGDAILQSHHQLPAGELVQIRGLMVTDIKPNELTLQHPIDSGIVVKVEGSSLPMLSLQDRVVVRGQVVYNRQQRLMEIAQHIFAQGTDVAIDVSQKSLPLIAGVNAFPNPLFLYDDILKQKLSGLKATVCGRMCPGMILVDQRQRGWLTDLELAGQRHAIFDFITLETGLRRLLVTQLEEPFSLGDYIQFEENLTAVALGEAGESPDHPRLKRAFLIIAALRKAAEQFMQQPVDFAGEYLPGLFLVNLGMLNNYDAIGEDAARLAFVTAAVVGKSIFGKGEASPYFFKADLFRQSV